MAKLFGYCPRCKKTIHNGAVMYRTEKGFHCSKKCAREVHQLTATEISFQEYIAG